MHTLLAVCAHHCGYRRNYLMSYAKYAKHLNRNVTLHSLSICSPNSAVYRTF